MATCQCYWNKPRFPKLWGNTPLDTTCWNKRKQLKALHYTAILRQPAIQGPPMQCAKPMFTCSTKSSKSCSPSHIQVPAVKHVTFNLNPCVSPFGYSAMNPVMTYRVIYLVQLIICWSKMLKSQRTFFTSSRISHCRTDCITITRDQSSPHADGKTEACHATQEMITCRLSTIDLSISKYCYLPYKLQVTSLLL